MASGEAKAALKSAGTNGLSAFALLEMNYDCRSRACIFYLDNPNPGLGWGNRAKPSEATAHKTITINCLDRNRGRRSHGWYSPLNQSATAVFDPFFGELIPMGVRLYSRFKGGALPDTARRADGKGAAFLFGAWKLLVINLIDPRHHRPIAELEEAEERPSSTNVVCSYV